MTITTTPQFRHIYLLMQQFARFQAEGLTTAHELQGVQNPEDKPDWLGKGGMAQVLKRKADGGELTENQQLQVTSFTPTAHIFSLVDALVKFRRLFQWHFNFLNAGCVVWKFMDGCRHIEFEMEVSRYDRGRFVSDMLRSLWKKKKEWRAEWKAGLWGNWEWSGTRGEWVNREKEESESDQNIDSETNKKKGSESQNHLPPIHKAKKWSSALLPPSKIPESYLNPLKNDYYHDEWTNFPEMKYSREFLKGAVEQGTVSEIVQGALEQGLISQSAADSSEQQLAKALGVAAANSELSDEYNPDSANDISDSPRFRGTEFPDEMISEDGRTVEIVPEAVVEERLREGQAGEKNGGATGLSRFRIPEEEEDDASEMINFVEIGVFQGRLSYHVLRMCPFVRFTGVDPYIFENEDFEFQGEVSLTLTLWMTFVRTSNLSLFKFEIDGS